MKQIKNVLGLLALSSVLALALPTGVFLGVTLAGSGCTTLYRGVVTMSDVVDKAMTAWADLSVKGATTPAVDARVKAAHAQYQKSAAVARDALIAYKQGGDKATYEQALAAAQVAMNGVVNIILPLLTPDKADTLRAQASKAKGV